MLRKFDKNLLICVFCSLLMASVSFGYFIYKGNGAFTLVSDFNAQELTFAAAVRHALIFRPLGQWIWNLDLGSSLINGFSFYNIGSLFFWISMLFTKISFPYLAGYLYILKYVVASITAYYYIKIFVKDSKYAVIGALLYSFSGFQTTNLIFHFHDVVAFFPMMLLGLELVIKDKKYTPVFIFAIFLNCITNYFFFIQEVIFVVLYFVVREWSDIGKNAFFKRTLRYIFSGVLGVGMASIIFVPSIIYIMGNPRSESALYLQNLAYDARNLLFIIKGMIMPGDVMKDQSILFSANFNSTSCYLPVFGAAFSIMYIFKNKGWLRNLLLALFVISFFPILQATFILYKGEFIYQRWWFMFILLMSLSTSLVIEKHDDYPIFKFVSMYTVFVAIFYIAISFLKYDSQASQVIFHAKRFLLFTMIVISGLVIIVLLNYFKRFDFVPLLILTMVYGSLTTFLGISLYRNNTDTNAYMTKYKVAEKFDVINEQYRYNSGNNISTLAGQAAGTGVFSSTVENTSKEFDKIFNDYDSVNTRLSVLHNDYTNDFMTFGPPSTDARVLLLGGKYIVTQDRKSSHIIRHYVENGQNYYIKEVPACPIGFALNKYITKKELMKIPLENRALTMMNAVVIDSNIKSEVNDTVSLYRGKVYAKRKGKYIANANKLRVRNFKRDNTGFSCSTNYENKKIVWFSVPYDSGWKATIDGKNAEIIKSAGMMAVKVPKGNHKLIFKYCTPCFKIGMVLSIVSFIVFILYSVVSVVRTRKS